MSEHLVRIARRHLDPPPPRAPVAACFSIASTRDNPLSSLLRACLWMRGSLRLCRFRFFRWNGIGRGLLPALVSIVQGHFRRQLCRIRPEVFLQDDSVASIPRRGSFSSARKRPNRHSGRLGASLFDVAVLPWPDRQKTGLLVGVGPSFVFPTATSKSAGQGAWQAGASGCSSQCLVGGAEGIRTAGLIRLNV